MHPLEKRDHRGCLFVRWCHEIKTFEYLRVGLGRVRKLDTPRFTFLGLDTTITKRVNFLLMINDFE